MGSSVGCFPPLDATVVPSGTMKANPQGEGLQLVPTQGGPLGPVYEVHDVFSNRDLPSASEVYTLV